MFQLSLAEQSALTTEEYGELKKTLCALGV